MQPLFKFEVQQLVAGLAEERVKRLRLVWQLLYRGARSAVVMFVMWGLGFCHQVRLVGRVVRHFASAVRHVWWVCGIVRCRFDVMTW